MVAEDIWGSEAHAIMLAHCGIISETDLREILKWLEQAREAWEDGSFELCPELEDVHMNVETYLREGRRAGVRRAAAHRALAERPGRH